MISHFWLLNDCYKICIVKLLRISHSTFLKNIFLLIIKFRESNIEDKYVVIREVYLFAASDLPEMAIEFSGSEFREGWLCINNMGFIANFISIIQINVDLMLVAFHRNLFMCSIQFQPNFQVLEFFIFIFSEVEAETVEVLHYDTFLLYARSENSCDRWVSRISKNDK